MKLQEKVYHFSDTEGKEVTLTNLKQIFVAIDDDATAFTVESVFKKITAADEKTVKGYSMLEKCVFNDDGYLVYEGKRISFYDSESGMTIAIAKKRNPVIQMNDLIITDDEIDAFRKIILDHEVNPIVVKEENEEATDEKTTETEVEQTAEEIDDVVAEHQRDMTATVVEEKTEAAIEVVAEEITEIVAKETDSHEHDNDESDKTVKLPDTI
jgi:hypothetical protein